MCDFLTFFWHSNDVLNVFCSILIANFKFHLIRLIYHSEHLSEEIIFSKTNQISYIISKNQFKEIIIYLINEEKFREKLDNLIPKDIWSPTRYV